MLGGLATFQLMNANLQFSSSVSLVSSLVGLTNPVVPTTGQQTPSWLWQAVPPAQCMPG